jgi:signal peptidase II
VPPASKTTEPADARWVGKSRYFLFAAIVSAGILADLATKHWIFAWLGVPDPRLPNPPHWVIQDIFGFQTSLNKGALFGLGQDWTMLFAGLSVAATLAILYWLFVAKAARSLLLTSALALITAGILGNLYDRLGLHGLQSPDLGPYHPGGPIYAVRDWILARIYHWDWPNFNLADSMLVVGASLLFWQAYFGSSEQAG